MTAGDFELAGISLTMIKARLNAKPDPQTNSDR